MADVDMPDVDQAASSKLKTLTKTSKAGPAESASDGKKRFEVKKVHEEVYLPVKPATNTCSVECCRSLGLGYRR